MNDSSDNIVNGVGPAQIRVLLDLLHESAWRNRSFVEGRYCERACNFAETLTFLQRIGWVSADGAQLHAVNLWTDRVIKQDGNDASLLLLEALLDSPGEHRWLFARYLARFQNDNGVVSCAARGELDLADTPTRDFLMELGAVSLDPTNKRYFLRSQFFGAYLWALAQQGSDTHDELMERLGDLHRLGLGAELAVVAFERERLGTRWADRVQHVAGEHPGASFDIKSLTVTEQRVCPRYIEVKAVSPSKREFHCSSSEIEAARLLSSHFFLYLVPTHGPNDFDVAQVEIIADPFNKVYSQPSAWQLLPTNFLCRPAKPSIS